VAKIGFIGLGTMGFPMAGHLQGVGHEVTVFNRSPEKSQKWLESYAGNVATSPRECAEGKDFVISCVGRDSDLEEVTLGEQGAFHNMKPGAVFVDHTTTSASIATRLYREAQQRDFHFLDGPVSGGQSGAENGVLSIMLGGDENVFAQAEPVLQSYGKTIALIGESGSGQLCKMVNQICIAGLLQSLSEALFFGRESGLDMEKVISVISGGAAQSWQMENRYQTMLNGEYDFGFAVDWMRKDFDIVKQEAEKNNLKLPVLELVDAYYKDVQEMGGGRWDTSSLFARLESLTK